MSALSTLRANWRVFALVVVLVGSVFVIFSPTFEQATAPGATDQDATNIQYGLQLSGGTRIRAPLAGVTAEEVQFDGDGERQVEQAVAANLEGANVADVDARVRTQEGTGTVEVTAGGVGAADLESALDAAGYGYGTVRDGVTAETRRQVVEVLRNKINEAGLSGGTVQTVTTASGEHFVLVEVPNEDQRAVRELLESRGSVRVDAYYPTGQGGSGEYRQMTVLNATDFQNVGTAQQGSEGIGPHVPVTVNESAAPRFQEQMVETGIAGQEGSRCNYRPAENQSSGGACLLLVSDGEVVNSFGMSPSLAQDMRSGAWARDPRFVLEAQNFSEAREIAINLRAGTLPTRLALEEGTSSYIAPSQGDRFKSDSLIAGLVAVLAVAAVVFFRYGEARVAAPMVVTALSEVVVLLGFAAGVGYPLDLSVIAGFIAVIGTGVDDLIIIADEVMSQGEVSSRRVFQSRFRKAFWVIGAAAATTIIAMSPLAVLSLGDLQGFAIFTILGVVVGVLLTRPAYGDILRALVTDR